jgi:hypothetical protein
MDAEGKCQEVMLTGLTDLGDTSLKLTSTTVNDENSSYISGKQMRNADLTLKPALSPRTLKKLAVRGAFH